MSVLSLATRSRRCLGWMFGSHRRRRTRGSDGGRWWMTGSRLLCAVGGRDGFCGMGFVAKTGVDMAVAVAVTAQTISTSHFKNGLHTTPSHSVPWRRLCVIQSQRCQLSSAAADGRTQCPVLLGLLAQSRHAHSGQPKFGQPQPEPPTPRHVSGCRQQTLASRSHSPIGPPISHPRPLYQSSAHLSSPLPRPRPPSMHRHHTRQPSHDPQLAHASHPHFPSHLLC